MTGLNTSFDHSGKVAFFNTQEEEMLHDLILPRLLKRFEKARERHQNWQNHWQEAYDYTMPCRGEFHGGTMPGARKGDKIYDATAMDAVEQLAASLLGNLTPPWSQWFGLKPGPDLSAEQKEALSPVLENAARTIQSHFDRSNFAVEIHQCFLDLVIGGTACLYFEENDPGHISAFRFTSIPLRQIVLEEGVTGLLDGSFRLSELSLAHLRERFPDAVLPHGITGHNRNANDLQVSVIEALVPSEISHDYYAFITGDDSGQSFSAPHLIHYERLDVSPFINFRWVKSPGEIYGRSPVMKALPDIKTANKVVELILKNASIAVTGIWQADDDGVLNPSTIELTPGSIIPKAIGSRGLQPLDMPGKFDISQIVLDDLRSRIRHSMLVDRLTQIDGRSMTATEVLERSAEMALLLGATYGRLQTELLIPLVEKAFSILKRRGEIPDISLDGRTVQIDFRSPLARAQGQKDIQNTLTWINTVLSIGGEAIEAVDMRRAATYLGQALGVPSNLIREELPVQGTAPHDPSTQNTETSSNV